MVELHHNPFKLHVVGLSYIKLHVLGKKCLNASYIGQSSNALFNSASKFSCSAVSAYQKLHNFYLILAVVDPQHRT